MCNQYAIQKFVKTPKNKLCIGLFCQIFVIEQELTVRTRCLFWHFSNLCIFNVDNNFSWLIVIVSVFSFISMVSNGLFLFCIHCHIISILAACLNKTNLIHIALIKDNFLIISLFRRGDVSDTRHTDKTSILMETQGNSYCFVSFHR